MSRARSIIPYKMFTGSVVPNFLMRKSALSQGAKLCYGRLAQFAGKNGNAFPTQSKLADELGISTRMVRKYITELVDASLMEVEQNGNTQSNGYIFLWHPWMKDDPKIAKKERNHGSTQVRTCVPPAEDVTSGRVRNEASAPYNKENHTKENKIKETVFSPADCKTIFEVYPRKAARTKGIKEIESALQRLGSRDDIDEPMNFLLAKVKKFAASDMGQSGKYVPFAETWFADERYLDDPTEWGNNDSTDVQTHKMSDESNLEGLKKLQRYDQAEKIHEYFSR